MPRATELSLRLIIARMARLGATAPEIARQLDLPTSTVRDLIRRAYRRRPVIGPSLIWSPAIAPAVVAPPRTRRSWGRSSISAAGIPAGGPSGIRIELTRIDPRAGVPSDRTLQRWLRRHGLAPAPPGRPRATSGRRARRPHEVWEVDAAEQKRLATGRMISWLRVVDRAPARPYTAGFSPQGYFVQVSAGLVQAELRNGFARWGRPTSLQFDNGYPWGSCGDLPRPLALWLIGLGLSVTWVPPRTPQDNGVVERSQGVAKNWAEPDRCRSPGELQRRLDEEDRVQRECYPHAGLDSRMTAHPGLAHSGRPYDAAWERANWSFGAVLAYLATAQVVRRVDCSGKIKLYQHKAYVGIVNRGKEVVVQFDAGEAEWVISDSGGVELCRRPLTQFDAAGLRRLPTN